MGIRAVKHVNRDEDNRIEYLFVNFDYFDGNDLIAKLFVQEYHMLLAEKIDGIFYSIIKLFQDGIEYGLVWHEDVGNYIFSVSQDENSILELEQKLEVIVRKLDEMVRVK